MGRSPDPSRIPLASFAIAGAAFRFGRSREVTPHPKGALRPAHGMRTTLRRAIP
jgi:hypothetical protein